MVAKIPALWRISVACSTCSAGWYFDTDDPRGFDVGARLGISTGKHAGHAVTVRDRMAVVPLRQTGRRPLP